MFTMLRNAVFIWLMVSYEVACAVPLQLAPAMFWLDAHILRASSSTVCACTSKRPAMDRISCGSVIKREGISLSLLLVVGEIHRREGEGQCFPLPLCPLPLCPLPLCPLPFCPLPLYPFPLPLPLLGR